MKIKWSFLKNENLRNWIINKYEGYYLNYGYPIYDRVSTTINRVKEWLKYYSGFGQKTKTEIKLNHLTRS